MLEEFIMGAFAMGLAVISLFFLRYWRESRDRLFAWFALAFVILTLNRVILGLTDEAQEAVIPYLVRLLAYLMILGGIVDKNLRRT